MWSLLGLYSETGTASTKRKAPSRAEAADTAHAIRERASQAGFAGGVSNLAAAVTVCAAGRTYLLSSGL